MVSSTVNKALLSDSHAARAPSKARRYKARANLKLKKRLGGKSRLTQRKYEAIQSISHRQKKVLKRELQKNWSHIEGT